MPAVLSPFASVYGMVIGTEIAAVIPNRRENQKVPSNPGKTPSPLKRTTARRSTRRLGS